VREQLRALKEQAELEVKAKAEAESISTDEAAEAQLVQLEAQIEAKVKAETPARAEVKPLPLPAGPLARGDKVFIATFNTAAEVVSVQNKQVEVQMGAFRAIVPLNNVTFQEKAAVRPAIEAHYEQLNLPEAESPGLELDLRGQTTDEALLRLDQYLDQAFMARLPWVRIIHGKGSGVLRQTVRQELSGHPQVASFRAGDEGEGGEGVTVAKLAVG
jgi:DNA mismatch repair protein MutS2